MAEAFGLAANIVSIVHIATEVIKRLNDFKKTVDGLPRVLQDCAFRLPYMTAALKDIRRAIEQGRIPEGRRETLKQHLGGLEKHIRGLLDIVTKMRPKDSSSIARNFKAVTSFRYDEDINYHVDALQKFEPVLLAEQTILASGKDSARKFAAHFLEPGQYRLCFVY